MKTVKMYRDGKTCSAGTAQVKSMTAAGWSLKNSEEKVEVETVESVKTYETETETEDDTEETGVL